MTEHAGIKLLSKAVCHLLTCTVGPCFAVVECRDVPEF